MHTKQEQYKGFTIEIVSYDGLGTVRFNFFVKAEGFKSDGYGSLTAAKSAITKHLNLKADATGPSITKRITAKATLAAQAEATGKEVNAVVTNGLREKSIVKIKPATSGDKEYASVDAIRSDANRTTALLRYSGLVSLDGTPRNRDKRSRNQREGGYAGKRPEYRVNYDDTVTKIPAKHWRAHPSKGYDTLKTYAKFMQSLDQGE